MPEGRISIEHVAGVAGVAAGTVSKALSGDLEISEATRMRVYGAGLEPGPTLERRAFADVYGALQALPGGYQPDGICANDTVGYTVLQALVLEMLAVVGYDGTTDAERRKVRRSTVAVDKLEPGDTS